MKGTSFVLKNEEDKVVLYDDMGLVVAIADGHDFLQLRSDITDVFQVTCDELEEEFVPLEGDISLDYRFGAALGLLFRLLDGISPGACFAKWLYILNNHQTDAYYDAYFPEVQPPAVLH